MESFVAVSNHPMFAQYVTQYWLEYQTQCKQFAGTDSFNKGLCRHPDNSSFGPGERPGTKRCNILSCPMITSKKDKNYNKVYDKASQRIRRMSIPTEEIRQLTI